MHSAQPALFLSFFLTEEGNQAETKPFTTFSVFHDNLITRLKALSQIHPDFDKCVKEAETKFSEKLADMRRQLDTRWKQSTSSNRASRGMAKPKRGLQSDTLRSSGLEAGMKILLTSPFFVRRSIGIIAVRGSISGVGNRDLANGNKRREPGKRCLAL